MTKVEVLEHLTRWKLIPVLRSATLEEALSIAEILISSSIRTLEITLTIPGALKVFSHIQRRFPEILLGAGSVLDPESARVCVLEGANFIMSPALDLETIAFCRDHDITIIPGALTPTEIQTASRAGADAIKVFPASAVGGAPYLRSLLAPLPTLRLIPTGGVSVTTARSYIDAGAIALGVGSDLVNLEALRSRRPDLITAQVRRYFDVLDLE